MFLTDANSRVMRVVGTLALMTVPAWLISWPASMMAQAHEVNSVTVVNERNEGIESGIWIFDRLTRERVSKTPAYTDKNSGVLQPIKWQCKKNEVILAEPVVDVYSPELEDRQKECKPDVRVVLKLAGISAILFLEGDKRFAKRDYGTAASVYAEVAERSRVLYPALASEAERRVYGSIGAKLGVSDPFQFDTKENRYIATLATKDALRMYQESNGLAPSAEFDTATRTAFGGKSVDQFVTVAYKLAKPLGLEERGKYRVFFDLGKTGVENSWNDVFTKVVTDARKNGTKAITVTGFADSAELGGGSAALERLSERRAAAIREALIAAGIDSTQITTDWKGESENILPSAVGESEPVNRSVEIVVQQ